MSETSATILWNSDQDMPCVPLVGMNTPAHSVYVTRHLNVLFQLFQYVLTSFTGVMFQTELSRVDGVYDTKLMHRRWRHTISTDTKLRSNRFAFREGGVASGFMKKYWMRTVTTGVMNSRHHTTRHYSVSVGSALSVL